MSDPSRESDPVPDQVDTLTTPGSASGSDPGPDDAGPQFLPGTRFGRRYRMVELLGRGGMGEVYRADDLHLGQAVALKFLPRHLTDDATALARLRNEVRVARHVSHPNVCRVYDLGEVDGRLFLSMEYVDGEDLGSVLRRLGRPTHEKSIQIARQLCAGLAAAHEAGVLHRDLKPSNIMIDGKGRVRVTDFGLAAFSDDAGAREDRNGTPGYMAPEQIGGGNVSARSDVYSLGLTLYELFTGERAFRTSSFAELRRMQTAPPPTPSRLVSDLDPGVEDAILRCLEYDPRLRPASALAVAAALPGGDPIAEALAAGETPSPETVAAAGGRGVMRPAVAGLCLAGILGGLAALWLAEDAVHRRLPPPEKSPVILAETARTILAGAGVPEPADRAFWIRKCDAYLDYVARNDASPDRWSRLADRRPTSYLMSYRESPTPLIPHNPYGHVGFLDPPAQVVGSARVVLDSAGRLMYLDVVPRQLVSPSDDASEPVAPADFTALFATAGLDPAEFVETEPRWTPTYFADTRRAWTGDYPGQSQPAVRIEAAAVAGRPTYFDVIHSFTTPWQEPNVADASGSDRALEALQVAFAILVLIGAPWVARRNVKLGTGDRRGAIRIGIAVMVSTMLVGALTIRPIAVLDAKFEVIIPGAALALFFAAWTACAYLALEPYARRMWPETLITWNRVLLGRFRDPRVGRDVLIGGVAGVAIVLIQGLDRILPAWIGAATRAPFANMQDQGARAVAHLVAPDVLAWPTLMLLILTAALYLLRRPWLAVCSTLVLLVLLDHYWEGAADIGTPALISAVMETVVVWSIMLFVLIRFGLFAEIVAAFFVFRLQMWPFTADPTQWYAGTSFILLALLVTITIVAHQIATVGEGDGVKSSLDAGRRAQRPAKT